MEMKGRRIEIHVDRIDLAATPRDGERRLREAVARELTRLAGEARAGPHCIGPERRDVPASPHAPPAASGADAVAASIAKQVRAGLPRGTGR